MPDVLTRAQLRAAQRLLDGGATLSDIAARLGIGFAEACLGLFGDNQSTVQGKAGREESPAPLTQQGFATPDSLGNNEVGRPQSATLQSETSARVVPPRADTLPVDTQLPAVAEEPGQRFRLASEHGESLHHNERVLTRLPKFFWRGHADAVRALKLRRPQWARLKPVAVLS